MFHPAVKMYEEAQITLTFWRQNTIYITLISCLTQTQRKTCFALNVESPSLSTDRNLTDFVKYRMGTKCEALSFDLQTRSHRNVTQQERRHIEKWRNFTNGLGCWDSWGGINRTYAELRTNQAVHLNLKMCGLKQQTEDVVSSVSRNTECRSRILTKQRPEVMPYKTYRISSTPKTDMESDKQTYRN